MRLNSAGGDKREVRVSLSRVKFGEVEVDATTVLATRPTPEPPRLKRGADPQRGRLRKQANRTGKTWG